MSLTVRAAREADLPDLVDLNKVVHQLHVALSPDDFPDTVDPSALKAFFIDRLNAATSCVGVADLDGDLVGLVVAEAEERPPNLFVNLRSRVYVSQLSVAPTARRQGVASALMAFVEDWARAVGYTRIVLDNWTQNENAGKFFESRGYKAVRVIRRKVLA